MPVSRNALIQRLRRRLSRDGQQLRTARAQAHAGVDNAFYVVDTRTGEVVAQSVDAVALARELQLLARHEEVQS